MEQNSGTPPNSDDKRLSESGRDPADPVQPSVEPQLPKWATKSATNEALGDARFAAFIGRNWNGTYAKKLRHFREDPSFVPTWNWSAALFSPFWFLYRKLYLAFAIFSIAPGVAFRYLTESEKQLTPQELSRPENQPLMIMYLAISLSLAIAAGGTGNWLLFRRARAASTIVALQQLPEDASLALLHRIGGVNRIPTVVILLCSVVFTMAAVLGAA